MARTRDRLTALKVQKAKPGMHADGGNLWLQVTSKDARSWIFRFKSPVEQRERMMGLGPVADIPLQEAREAARAARLLIRDGIDPIRHREQQRAQAALAAAKDRTFAECAAEYYAEHEGGWRSAKHRHQWKSSVESYVNPIIGHLPVASIDDQLVIKVLAAIWKDKPETASRVRGRIETVLDFAAVSGARPKGDNPARWKGHLEHRFKERPKRKAGHAALPYTDFPAFWSKLAQTDSSDAKALMFTILTASRTGEVVGAKLSEFDLAKKLWTVPASRMKGHREHIVPLTDIAVKIVRELSKGLKPDGHLFKIGHETMLKLLDRMGYGEFTVHGFRSTFRDWAGDMTNHQRDIVEAALAHALEDETEAAYRRSTAIEKRRALMLDWERYATTPTGAKVVPLMGVR